MRMVIQRVSSASVSVNKTVKGKIDKGFMILLGIETEDSEEDVDWCVSKACNMRIFSDSEGKMNLSIKDVNGNILLVSQFTLHASTKKGNRPSFIAAARPEKAIPLYERFIQMCNIELGKQIETGEFGADMQVEIINDGPVTIIIDSKNKE